MSGEGLEGHRCKRWGPLERHCLFRRLPWHHSPQFDEGDEEWDDDDLRKVKTNVPYATALGLLVYKSLLDDYGPKKLPAFNPALLTQSVLQFHAGQGLAEIGMIQQLKQQAATQKASSVQKESEPGWNPDWDEVAGSMAWMIGGTAAVAVSALIARGAKGGAFRTALKYGWDPKGRSPLWSVTNGVTQLLAAGYVPKGSDVVKERTSFGQVAESDFGVGSAFAHGITGYI